jgi:hypothetical protein
MICTIDMLLGIIAIVEKSVMFETYVKAVYNASTSYIVSKRCYMRCINLACKYIHTA